MRDITIELSPIAAFISAQSGRLQDVNASFISLARLPRETLLHASVTSLLARQSVNAGIGCLDMALRTGYGSANVEFLTGDGSIAAGSMQTVRLDDDRILGFFHQFLERPDREHLLLQRDLAVSLAEATGLDSAIRLCLDAASRASGLEAGGVYLVNPITGGLDLVHHQGLSEAFAGAKRHFDRESLQARLVSRGKPLYTQFSKLPIQDTGGDHGEGLRAIAIVPVSHRGHAIGCLNLASRTMEDIPLHARGALEAIAAQIGQALAREREVASRREREASFNAFFDAIADLLFIVDLTGHIRRVNKYAAGRLGYTTSELTGHSILEVHPEALRREAEKNFREMAAGKLSVCKVPLLTRDGQEIPVEIRTVIGQWEGEPAVLGIARDMSEHVRARLELTESHSLLALALRVARMAHWRWAPSNDSLECFGEHTALSAANAPGFSIADRKLEAIGPPEERTQRLADLQKTIDAGIPYDHTFRDAGPGGAVRWLRSYGVPSRDENGNAWVFGVTQDITDYKRTERELAERVALQSALLENLQQGVLVEDSDRRVLFASQEFCRLFGLPSKEAIVGADCAAAAHAAAALFRDPAGFVAGIDTALAGGHISVSDRLEMVSGRILERIYSPVHAGQQKLGHLWLYRDRTDQVRAYADLSRAKAQWERTFDAVPDLICLIDREHRVIRANRAFLERMGGGWKDIIGRPCYECVHGLDCPPAYCPHTSTMADKKIHSIEVFERNLGGTHVVTTAPLVDADGETIGSVHVAHDVSAIRRHEKVLASRVLVSDYAASHTLDELMQFGLDQAETLLGSSLGFFHVFEEDEGTILLKAWSTNTLKICTAEGKGMHYPVGTAGVWAGCIRERKPLIHNDYASLPGKRGLPEGHAVIVRELVVPVFAGKRIAGVLGVGNKPSNYVQSDVETLTELAALLWDVIVRKQAQDALHASEESNKAIVSALPDMIFRFDEGARFVDCHAHDPSTLFISPGVFLGRHVEEVLPGPIGRLTRERIDATRSSRQMQVYEYSGFSGDEERFFEARMVPCGSSEVLSIVRDITEARRGARRLKEQNEFTQRVLDSIDARIAVVDSGGVIIEVNEAWRRFAAENGAGDERNWGIGSCYYREHAASEPGAEMARQAYAGMRRVGSGELPLFELEYPCPSPHEDTWFSMRVSPLRGRPGVILVSHTDISERKAAEQQRMLMERQILQTQKLESLGILAGGIAHDFNNILTAILGNASLASAELPPGSPAITSVMEIEQASRRAAELCRQMLAYSGRGRFIIEPIDLNLLTTEMLGLIRTSISKKVRINSLLAARLPRFSGDATQIRQVFMNIVLNAAEAIGDDAGLVTISTGARPYSEEDLRRMLLAPAEPTPGTYVFFHVADTGCGMDQATLERLFEPFFTTKFTGRGLGMSAVLGIMRGHKGGLSVQSTPGRGTSFTVLFPAAHPLDEAGMVRPVETRHGWKGTGCILVVDDEDLVRNSAKRMIETIGFTVLCARNGRHAMDIYMKDGPRIDIVLLDLTMPEMDGAQTLRALTEIDPSVRIIMCSGYSEYELEARFKGANVVGVLQKPYTVEMLRERLQGFFVKK